MLINHSFTQSKITHYFATNIRKKRPICHLADRPDKCSVIFYKLIICQQMRRRHADAGFFITILGRLADDLFHGNKVVHIYTGFAV